MWAVCIVPLDVSARQGILWLWCSAVYVTYRRHGGGQKFAHHVRGKKKTRPRLSNKLFLPKTFGVESKGGLLIIKPV